MAEIERTRVRERGALPENAYERVIRLRQEFLERQEVGPVVIKPAQRQWEMTRQGRLLFYLHPDVHKDTPLQDWLVFSLDIKTHSGKHRHQGGLAIYVLEGKGYTIIDGERVDWEAGDLLLLPFKPEGVEHQHFNTDPGKPCRWVAFVNLPIMDHVAMEVSQVELSPEFRQKPS
jgi:gentisate 1,2-dioxygenase